ncbi:MAG: DUF3267 domain-containing protein [Bacteroidetes bacterium]|nr:DUF3267 domain-containing protein [Bacteroidota bacterium]MBK9413459.1 DUF3267 domain-containing protein [Bacteroidota bacterium]MBL0032618.1 DUF3267 domain-containing protein [Bacteroidota bacterium]MBP6427810.1 DUF3267 domain-containing protein [Bacteroidia bacterium]MBP6657504.1 DUF3267 domain-containing protein [Bacteroidia bacterium]
MILIPGHIIAKFTFPGVVVHEFAHMLFCKVRKVAIIDVCYFRDGDPVGYVQHEGSTSFFTTFLISMGPFFVNSLLCLLICMPAYIPLKFFEIENIYFYFLLWLGISIGMHAIPSNQDATNVYNEAKIHARKGNLLAIISFPIVGLIYIFNLLRVLWADVFYGVGVGLGIPSLIFG